MAADFTKLGAENERLTAEVEELRLRLDEAEQALEAIRTGQAESLVVEGPDGLRIFSLEGADHSYRVLVEAMNEGAATIGEDGTILYCNSRFAEMLGAPLERVMGSAISRFIRGPSLDAFEALAREANGGESRGELELDSQDGQVVPALVSVSVIHDDHHRRLCLVATDLRAQKRSEEIVAAERLARSVLEQAAETIVVCDDQGRVIRASSMAAELCGRNPLFASFDVAFPVQLDLDCRNCDTVAACALRGEVVRAVPAWLERPDGSRAHLVVSASPLTDGGERIIGCVITMTDVTERNRAEEAVRDANLQLADTDRRKNEFLAMLSHELRNPLAPITSSLYILDRAVPGGDQARRAQSVISRQVDQLARLVDDLLDVTRISRNKVLLKLERLDLKEVVQRAVEDHRSLFEKSGVRLGTSFAGGPIVVSADWARIAQVVGNLLTNAAKFTGRGGSAQVSVARDDGERHAIIRVADTGPGIAPEMLDRLFQPFAQADRTLDRSKGGLGLGLALVRGLVELHGGTVSAYSAGAGHGTELIVQLPLEARATVTTTARAAAPHRRRRILVIEDNVDAADSLREALELDEHEVEVAYSGPEGLKKALAFRPDLVLCDIGLPGMDGYEVARSFRSDETLKRVHLVALSGYAMREDLERAAGAGFERHLAKPPSLEKIEEVLGSLG